MRAFICWSEPRSRQLAEALCAWLPRVCTDELSCGISTRFQAGEMWFLQLLRELDEAHAAIICLTPENVLSPWLHFEAGMAFRRDRETVLPYFLGPEVPEIKGPLNANQASPATHEGTWRLVQALARIGRLREQELRQRFDQHWPGLQRQLQDIAAPAFADIVPGFEALFDRKTFGEPLEQCTDQAWTSRYDGVRETGFALVQRREAVERCCQPWQTWMYRRLLAHLDGYARDLAASLLHVRRFATTETDQVDFARPEEPPAARPAGAIAASAARRCRQIRHLVHCLARPDGAPRLADALPFAKMDKAQFDDRKRLVQSKGSPVDRRALGLAADADLERCARSTWDFDRIIYYRVRRDEPAPPDTMCRLVEEELHQAEADGEAASKMPLHYAVKAWLSALEKQPAAPFDAVQAARVADGLLIYLDRTAKPGDDDPKIRAHLAAIRLLVDGAAPRQPGG